MTCPRCGKETDMPFHTCVKMNYTDTQLKQALAKMLPELLFIDDELELRWKGNTDYKPHVLNTELLHLCSLVERGLNSAEHCHYFRQIEHDMQLWIIEQGDSIDYGNIYSWAIQASWQQRVIALAKVKGVEIV